MKTVITMTSWTGRIQCVGFAIYRFFTTQTIMPDAFYLWLSTTEFPHRELDLPRELLAICHHFHVHICWVDLNEYCHKRWYVYPAHYNDLVISIDDDVFYDPNLIKQALKYATIYNNTIINIGTPAYHPLEFNNSIARKFGPIQLDTPLKNMQLCGQCIVLPKSFPKEVVLDQYIKLRQQYCKKCDESFLTPFLVKHGTSIIAHKWHNIVDDELQYNAISNDMKSRKDIQIYVVLRIFNECMESWKRLYPSYNTTYYDSLSLDKISALL